MKYTKDIVIGLLSDKKDWELVTIEFSNDIKMNKTNKKTGALNPYSNRNVKKYHKMKCITTYNYEEELKKRCLENWKVYEWLKWWSRWERINENPYLIRYIKDGEENHYLQVVPAELVEFYYLLDGKLIDEKELEPYLTPKNDGVVKRIKLKDIISIN